MSQVLALAARQIEAVGAPVHRHVDLGKQFATNAGGFATAADRRHSPSPLRSTSSRTRAPNINAVDADGGGMFEPLNANTAGAAPKQDGSRDLICLCTPAPKIPRPRNAFILYRQHHQAQVTADNPKLSNPDISKIIGEQWKNEDEEVKQKWKKLAEEEKQRHQNQYPNYRYQPRRGNKPQPGWTSSSSPTEEHGRCPKCNGRAMVTPQTPSTPFATSPAGKLGVAAQGPPSLQRIDTALSRRSSFEQSPTSTLPFPTQLPPVRDVDKSEPPSPEIKRRRADGAGGYHAIGGPLANYGSKQPGDMPLTPTEPVPHDTVRSYARTPLPELGSLTRPQSGPMPPPLRPSTATSWLVDQDHQIRRPGGFDESLRLPPLQTSISPSPSRTSVMESRPGGFVTTILSPSRENQVARARTVSDVIMSISFKRKIAVLASICQPAPPLGKDDNPDGTRGAFIAVEGPNARLLQEAGNAIEKGLLACGEILLKVWRDDSDGQERTGGDKSSTPQQLGRGGAIRFGDLFEPYLKTVSSWQKKSKQIGRHVTGRATLHSNAEEQKADGERVVTHARSTEACTPPDDDKSQASVARIPVALAKHGFSLTIADRYACTVPILDMYAPVDHWQWMATLWRGTVCPDLIVYVMPSEEEESKERRTVELSRRMGLIVVRVPASTGLDEATERRLAFEVMEWMREGSFRENLPRDWRSGPLC